MSEWKNQEGFPKSSKQDQNSRAVRILRMQSNELRPGGERNAPNHQDTRETGTQGMKGLNPQGSVLK